MHLYIVYIHYCDPKSSICPVTGGTNDRSIAVTERNVWYVSLFRDNWHTAVYPSLSVMLYDAHKLLYDAH